MTTSYAISRFIVYLVLLFFYYQVMIRLVSTATPVVFTFLFVLYTLVKLFPPKHYAKEIKDWIIHWTAIFGFLIASLTIAHLIIKGTYPW